MAHYKNSVSLLKSCSNFEDFCFLLSTDSKTVNNALSKKKYNCFTVPKKNGKKRKIENPQPKLHLVQKRLAYVFNLLYKEYLPKNSHGFIPKYILNEGSRDIFSNAQSHLNCNYLYNLDLKDFFHSITDRILYSNLKKLLPNTNNQIIETIVTLCTYKNRLPMGAPSSPVLSNLSSIDLDIDMQNISLANNIVYTRYVDDLSFSTCELSLPTKFINEVKYILKSHRLSPNNNKEKHYTQNDKKHITGLIIENKKLVLSNELYSDIQQNIKKLKSIKQSYQNMKMLGSINRKALKINYKNIKNSVKGQLSFCERILTENHPKYLELSNHFFDVKQDNNYLIQNVYI